MRILYAIQGTGNGHLSRARDIVPLLGAHGQVDVLVSGAPTHLQLPFPVRYHCHGLGFVSGRRGGIDLWQTCRRAHAARLVREIRGLPVRDYDLVISDFEPVSAWACAWQRHPCVGLSHQYAVLAAAAPKPSRRDWLGEFILRRYAPAAAHYGFHFATFAGNIYTPVIRRQVRRLVATRGDHYTVYLPAYGEETLIRKLSRFSGTRWQVFSQHCRQPFSAGNVAVQPVDNEAFVRSMATGRGVLCGAGFETPAEALFLGKKLLVIPMKGQYEQQLNAAALAHLGVPVIRSLKKKHFSTVESWLQADTVVPVDFPDQTSQIIAHIVDTYARRQSPPVRAPLAAAY